MARIRTIKPEFFRHAGLFDAEVETGLPLRIAFAGLWSACDREGRFAWRPRELKLDALPFDDVDFSRVLEVLWTRGHVAKYSVNGVDFGFIPSWHRHQVINNRESASVLPEPVDASICKPAGTRGPRVVHASPTPLVHAQGEGKGKEGKGREHALPDGSLFDEFWSQYPKKAAKKEARTAFDKINPSREKLDTMLAAVAAQKRSDEWTKDKGQYIPHPATWLNAERWTDELAVDLGTPVNTDYERNQAMLAAEAERGRTLKVDPELIRAAKATGEAARLRRLGASGGPMPIASLFPKVGEAA